MSMGMEVTVFLAYAFGLLMVYIFGRFLLVKLKWLMLGVVNSLLGGLAIMLLNCFGAGWGIFIPLNMITAVIAGVLGVPGIIMMALFYN